MPQSLPLLLAALLQAGLGLWRRQSSRFAFGLCGLVLVAFLEMPVESQMLRRVITFHLALAAMLIVGAEFDDLLARVLRMLGAGLVLASSLIVLFADVRGIAGVPAWLVDAYPLAMSGGLGIYGLVLGQRTAQAVCALVLSCWLAAAGWWCYHALRLAVTGLDYIAISLLLFAVAILVSMGKSGMLQHGLQRLRRTFGPPLEEVEA